MVSIQACNRSSAHASGDPPPAGAHGDRNDTMIGFTVLSSSSPQHEARNTQAEGDGEHCRSDGEEVHVFNRLGRRGICCTPMSHSILDRGTRLMRTQITLVLACTFPLLAQSQADRD